MNEMEIGYFISSRPREEVQQIYEGYYNNDNEQGTFEEYMEKHYGDAILEFNQQYLAESSNGTAYKSVRGWAVSMLLHMLKYKFQMWKQSSSWMNRILEEHKKVCEGLGEENSNFSLFKNDYENIYRDAVKGARAETGLNDIPYEIQIETSLESVLNIDKVLIFLDTYAYSDEAKRYLDGKNKGYFKNLSEINNSKRYRNFKTKHYKELGL